MHHQSFLISKVSDDLVTSPQFLGPITWIRPSEGVVKCNVVAAVVDLFSCFGYGCVVHNSFGVVLDAIFGKFRGSFCPSLAEAISIREALSWMHNLGYSNVVVESDVMVVIDALNNTISISSSLGLIVDDCKSLVRIFLSCQFVLAYRSENQAVHALAREAVPTPVLLGRVVLSPTLISVVTIPDLG